MTCKNLGVALALALTVLSGCTESTPNKATASPEEPAADMPVPIDPNRFEIHGHRGSPRIGSGKFHARICAGLEGRCRCSGDGHVHLCRWGDHHQPRAMDEPHHLYGFRKKTHWPSDQPRKHNLYKMTAEEIASFDCGSVPHPDFPSQRNLPAYKPTLDQVIKLTETVPLLDGTLARYNLEIKHSEELENEFCPDAESFARIVLEKIILWESLIAHAFKASPLLPSKPFIGWTLT